MIKSALKSSIFLKQLVRNYRLRKTGPAWEELLRKDKAVWEAALAAKKSKRILIATSVGAFLPGTTLESLLAVALTLRNAEIHVLLCDGVLPACMECVHGLTIQEKRFAKAGPQKELCRDCFTHAYAMYKKLGLTVHRYSGLISEEDRAKAGMIAAGAELARIKEFTYEGLAVGEHALAGALRFYAKGELERDERAEVILRRYLNAAMLTVFATNKLLERYQYDRALFHHGIYVPQGLIGEVCRSKKVNIVNWNPAYRKQCFIFSHDDTYHHTMMTEPTKNWEDIPWNDKLQKKLTDYLQSRWHGTKDWIWFHDKNPRFDVNAYFKETGIDPKKPCVGLLTNVVWDAQLHYPTNVFPGMIDWILQTIAYFGKRPGVQLLIRVHPAEIRGTIPSRQTVAGEIAKRFPVLPKNVFLIGPENPISTYPVMEKCNAVVIYGTKTGVELSCKGIPVIVAGEAWIRNKGLTIDPSTQEEYFKALDALPLVPDRTGAAMLQRAYRYAYHFFFRRMIQLPLIESRQKELIGIYYHYNFGSLADLLPSKNPALDVICDGVLKGSDFVFPDEKYV